MHVVNYRFTTVSGSIWFVHFGSYSQNFHIIFSQIPYLEKLLYFFSVGLRHRFVQRLKRFLPAGDSIPF